VQQDSAWTRQGPHRWRVTPGVTCSCGAAHRLVIATGCGRACGCATGLRTIAAPPSGEMQSTQLNRFDLWSALPVVWRAVGEQQVLKVGDWSV